MEGKSRTQEKTKEIRQSFSKALVSGSRSGSGKLAFEHYEKLVSIWVGSANVEPLSFGISSGELDDEHVDSNQDESDSDHYVDIGNSLQTSTPANIRKRRWVVRLYQD